jgi:hypothetical protein
MSCLIGNGRLEACKDSISGISNIFFINFGEIDTVTYSGTAPNLGDDIQGITGVTKLYKYELKGANGLLTVQFKRQDIKTHKNIKFIAYGRPYVVVQSRTNEFFLMGLNEGADVESGSVNSGVEYTDYNGYNLVLKSTEQRPANYLSVTDAVTGEDRPIKDETELVDVFGLVIGDIVTT